jgi:hypothetical protein
VTWSLNPEQTLSALDGEPSRAEFKESPIQPPIPARPANPSRGGGGIGASAGVIDRPEPSLRIDGDPKVMPTRPAAASASQAIDFADANPITASVSAMLFPPRRCAT